MTIEHIKRAVTFLSVVFLVTMAALVGGLYLDPARADSGPPRDTSSAVESHGSCLAVVDGLAADVDGFVVITRAQERVIARLYRKVDRQAATIERLRERLAGRR